MMLSSSPIWVTPVTGRVLKEQISICFNSFWPTHIRKPPGPYLHPELDIVLFPRANSAAWWEASNSEWLEAINDTIWKHNWFVSRTIIRPFITLPDRFLIRVIPATSYLASCVPDLLDQWIHLNYYHIFWGPDVRPEHLLNVFIMHFQQVINLTDLLFCRIVPHLIIGMVNVYLALSSLGSTYLVQRKQNKSGC